MAKYRQVGGRLGAYIRANNPSKQQIQGLLADLLAEDELLATMREVVIRPSFHTLQGLAGSGGGAVQRDVLLQELGRRYLPSVVEEVAQLINGMLDLPGASEAESSRNIQRITPGVEANQRTNHHRVITDQKQEKDRQSSSSEYEETRKTRTSTKNENKDWRPHPPQPTNNRGKKGIDSDTLALFAASIVFVAVIIFLALNNFGPGGFIYWSVLAATYTAIHFLKNRN